MEMAKSEHTSRYQIAPASARRTSRFIGRSRVVSRYSSCMAEIWSRLPIHRFTQAIQRASQRGQPCHATFTWESAPSRLTAFSRKR